MTSDTLDVREYRKSFKCYMITLYNTKFYKVMTFTIIVKQTFLVLPKLALRISKLYGYLSYMESSL